MAANIEQICDVTRLFFAPPLADYKAPTAAEIGDAVDLTSRIVGDESDEGSSLAGFDVSRRAGGGTVVTDLSFAMYDADGDTEGIFEVGDELTLILCPEGFFGTMNIFPAVVVEVVIDRTTIGPQPVTVRTTKFAPIRVPALDVAFPLGFVTSQA